MHGLSKSKYHDTSAQEDIDDNRHQTPSGFVPMPKDMTKVCRTGLSYEHLRNAMHYSEKDFDDFKVRPLLLLPVLIMKLQFRQKLLRRTAKSKLNRQKFYKDQSPEDKEIFLKAVRGFLSAVA